MSVLNNKVKWINRRKRLSHKIRAKLKCPRLIIFRSNKNIFVQILDHLSNETICSSSSIDKSLSSNIKKSKSKIEMSKIVAVDLSKKLKSKKIKNIVFDRSGYRYHGRVKVIADTLRENKINV